MSMCSLQFISVRRLICKGACLPAGHNQVKPCVGEGSRGRNSNSPAPLHRSLIKKGAPVIPVLTVQGLQKSPDGSKTFVLCDRPGRGTVKKSERLIQKAGAGAGS